MTCPRKTDPSGLKRNHFYEGLRLGGSQERGGCQQPWGLAGGWRLDAGQRTAVEGQQTPTTSLPQGVWLIESKQRAESGFIPI